MSKFLLSVTLGGIFHYEVSVGKSVVITVAFSITLTRFQDLQFFLLFFSFSD